MGRVDRIDFQYSIDATSLTTGTWVDVDALDFVAPTTTGTTGPLIGNASANSTTVNSTITGLSIPAGAVVWIRWTSFDASGADDGLAIDNFSISVPTTIPTVNLSLTANAGSEAGQTVITVTATTSSAVSGNETVDLAVAGTGITAGDYTLSNSTITIADGQSTGSATFTIVDDADIEGSETARLTISNPSTGITLGTIASQDVVITDNDVAITKIHQIQGNATTQLANISGSGAHDDRSPLVGQTVTIEGVVTADFQLTTQLRGFFIQEETADQDGDTTTSEGIFIFTGSAAPFDVSEGQKVRVTGAVSEFFGMTQLTATASGSISLIDGANNLGQVPATIIDLPAVGDLDDYYEQFEGMKVQFSDKLVVSEYFELARYGQLVLTEGDRPFQYSHIDNTPTAAEYATFLDSLNRSRIILDDGNNTQNAPLPSGVFPYPQPGGLSIGGQGTIYFRGGDSITGLTGVLHWSFAGQSGTDAWRIRPTQADPISFAVENPRAAAPPSVGGNVKVASFNVLNYFNTIDTMGGNNSPRGADSADEFTRQNEKLVAALQGINADIFGLVEIENNGTAVQELVNRLNAVVGAGTYDYINTGVVGTDQITVAVIYKSSVVQPKGTAAILNNSAFTDPNGTGQQRSRPAIAQTFEVIDTTNPDFGAAFNVVVNHLKSKGSDGAVGADLDQNDGQGAWNDTRTKAAAYLANVWIPSDPTGQGDADWLIIGDLNAYKGETPITALKNAGYNDLVDQFGGSNAYGYVFNGQLGYLDYALANGSLASQVTGVAEWHINADEVPVFDYNNTIDDGAGESSFEAKPTGNPLYEANAFRTSDHDPVIIGLNLTVPNKAPTAVNLANTVTTLAENTSTVTRIKVADISVTDDAQGTNVLSLSGTDTSFFEIDSNALYLKSNTTLDFEARASYAVTVNVDDASVGNTPDASSQFSLMITDLDEDPTVLTFTGWVGSPATNSGTWSRTDDVVENQFGGITVAKRVVASSFNGNDSLSGIGPSQGILNEGIINTGNGADRITGQGPTGIVNLGVIRTENGDDVVDALIGGFAGNGLVQMGRGNDSVLGFGPGIFHGGMGIDSIFFNPGTYDVSSRYGRVSVITNSSDPSLAGIEMIVSGFEFIGSASTESLQVFSSGSFVIP